MDLERLQELMRIFQSSELMEIEIEEEGRRVRLRKARPKTIAPPQLHYVPGVPLEQAPASVMASPAAAAPEASSVAPEEESLPTFDAPMVGVFYVAPAPGEPPFVQPGDTVDENQTVCIVEAMKLMNEVPAGFPAVIEKVLVENGEPVEYGQPLFAVRPIEQV